MEDDDEAQEDGGQEEEEDVAGDQSMSSIRLLVSSPDPADVA